MTITDAADAGPISVVDATLVAVDAIRDLVYADSAYLDGVRVLGVDEHVWKHTRRPCGPSSMVTVLVDLTPLVDGGGPARLIDMRPGRSADALRTRLTECDPQFRAGVQVVTMDGFTGYAAAVDQTLPAARKVMDPFHVVHLGSGQAHRVSTTPAARHHRATGGRMTRCTSTAGAC